MLAPPLKQNRRSSTEMLNVMADFEESQGFPLLGGHWLEDDASSNGGNSDTDSPVASDKNSLCRQWIPTKNDATKNDSLLLPANQQLSLSQ